MSSLIYSFVSQYSLNISIKTLNAYINYFFNFLSSNASSSISYITFHSFFKLCPFISARIFHLFLHLHSDSNEKVLPKESFIEGLSLLLRLILLVKCYSYQK